MCYTILTSEHELLKHYNGNVVTEVSYCFPIMVAIFNDLDQNI